MLNTDGNIVTFLGVAQLLAFLTAIVSDRLLASVVQSDDISEILENILQNLSRVRSSNLIAWSQSVVLILLGVIYYAIFYQAYLIISLLALGFFLAGAISVMVGKMGAIALIPLSQKFIDAGSPKSTYFQTLGDFLHNGIDKQGLHLNFFFTTLGFSLVNYLLLVSNVIPRFLSIWAFIAVLLAIIPAILQLYKRDINPLMMVLVIPYAPT